MNEQSEAQATGVDCEAIRRELAILDASPSGDPRVERAVRRLSLEKELAQAEIEQVEGELAAARDDLRAAHRGLAEARAATIEQLMGIYPDSLLTIESRIVNLATAVIEANRAVVAASGRAADLGARRTKLEQVLSAEAPTSFYQMSHHMQAIHAAKAAENKRVRPKNHPEVPTPKGGFIEAMAIARDVRPVEDA